MAFTMDYGGMIETPVCQHLTNTSKTVIGSTYANDASTLSAVAIANAAGAAKTVSVYWYNGSTESLIWRKSIAQNDSALLTDLPIRLRKGHEIRVAGDADVHVTLIHSFALPYAQSQGGGMV